MYKHRSLIPIIIIITFIAAPAHLDAQDHSVTVFEYLHIPDARKTAFIQGELSAGSRRAAVALRAGTITFWELLEQVGDLPGSANFLRVTTYPDIDKAGAFRDTGSTVLVTARYFLHDGGWEMSARARMDRDLNYVVMLYHNTDYADSLIAMERKFWGPFIKQAMDAGRTNQQAWGNAVLLAPVGDEIKFTTVSYDLFRTLQDALMPYIDPTLVQPEKEYAMMRKMEKGRRSAVTTFCICTKTCIFIKCGLYPFPNAHGTSLSSSSSASTSSL
jgi:hypothetical protein